MIIISTHAPRMIPSEHLSRQRAGMSGIFDLSLVKNISLGKRFEGQDLGTAYVVVACALKMSRSTINRWSVSRKCRGNLP